MKELVPTIQADDLNAFHYSNIAWHPTISETKHHHFHINTLEEHVAFLKFPIPPHRKTVHDLIFLRKGTSTRRKGLNSYAFKEHELFFLPAFQLTEHFNMSLDAEGFFIHFDPSIFQFLPKSYLTDHFPIFMANGTPVMQFTEEQSLAIDTILKRLHQLYLDPNHTSNTLIASYLLAIFEEVHQGFLPTKRKTKNAYDQVTDQYKNALSLHIYQKQRISEYADFLNISPNYLNKCVKNSLQKTAQDLLNEMLILEAKTLLKFSNLQIAEVAIRLCNQTPSNFSRFFKNQTGYSPKTFLELY